MEMLKRGLKIRQVTALLQIPKSSIFYRSLRAERDSHIAHLIREVALKRNFYGYRRIYLTLRKIMKINHKKVYRLYSIQNLQRHSQKAKKRGINIPVQPITEAVYPNHVWAIDFLFDRLSDGRLLKLMPVLDTFSKFSVGIDVKHRITSLEVQEFLEQLFYKYGKPSIIRTDNGPEFRSKSFARFLERHRIRHEFIRKGSPWQNSEIESFNGKLRDECLERNIFEDLIHAQNLIEQHRVFYNTIRPHSALNGDVPCDNYIRRIENA